MSGGANAMVGYSSYLLVGREATFKTYNTCTAQLNFLKAKFNMEKDQKILQEISMQRTFANRIGLGRKVSGEVDFYMSSDNLACQYILQNAFGGGKTGGYITSATTVGDTTGAGVFDHVYAVGNYDQTWASLCFNHRKGDTSLAKVYEYAGFRVDQLNLKAKIDDALMCSAKMVGVDCSLTTNDLNALVVNNTTQTPLSFVGMRFSVEGSVNSLTTTSFWHVQSIDFTMKNSIKSDATSRRIGSDLVEVLQPGIMMPSLKVQMRFDDLAAYNAMLAETQLSAQMVFTGATITGSKFPQLIQFDMPVCYIKNAGDPEVGGPDEILKSDVEFDILRDISTTTGYAVKATVRNKTSTYT